MSFNLELLILEDVLTRIIEEYRPVADEKNISIRTSFLDPQLTLKADRLRLRQVFGNILSNAIKFLGQKK